MHSRLSQEVVDDVIATYKKTGNSPFKTARMCGVDVADVFSIVDTNQDRIASATEHNGGMGRGDLQPYMVARRKAMDAGWDNTIPEIAKARADYEAGTHEMATGRDGQWLILYSIPRRRREPNREGYFMPEQSL